MINSRNLTTKYVGRDLVNTRGKRKLKKRFLYKGVESVLFSYFIVSITLYLKSKFNKGTKGFI